MPLCDFVAPLESIGNGGIGSTDMGDVSWVVPTVQARIATCAVGTPFHTWQTDAQGKAPCLQCVLLVSLAPPGSLALLPC